MNVICVASISSPPRSRLVLVFVYDGICLLCRIGMHADVRYGAVRARWQGLGAWRTELIKLSHDYCNLIGSHNIPRLHTESRLQSPDVPSPPRTSGPRDYPYPSQSVGPSPLLMFICKGILCIHTHPYY